jgi:hypothetical protein
VFLSVKFARVVPLKAKPPIVRMAPDVVALATTW